MAKAHVLFNIDTRRASKNAMKATLGPKMPMTAGHPSV